jgi:hypothetical protein
MYAQHPLNVKARENQVLEIRIAVMQCLELIFANLVTSKVDNKKKINVQFSRIGDK